MDTSSASMFNAVLVGVTVVVACIAIAWALRPTGGQRQALQWSERSHLPLQESPTADRIVARLRRQTIAQTVGAACGTVLAAAMLLTPLRDLSDFPVTILLPLVLITATAADAGVAVRSQLFRPDPAARRVARARALTSADYLDRPRRALWIALGVIGAGGIAAALWALVRTDTVTSLAGAALAIGTAGVVLILATGGFERTLLSRPQPASTPIELAWDDVFRLRAMNVVRTTVGTLCVASPAVVLAAITGDRFLTSQLIVWSQIALSLVFRTNAPRLPRSLRPRQRMTPAAAVEGGRIA